MLKKLFCAALLSGLAAFSVFAQSKAGNFLGTWKLTEIKGSMKNSTIDSMVLNISQTGDEIKIEKITQGVYLDKPYSLTRTELYALNGSDSVSVVGGLTGGTQTNRMRLLAPDKLRFDSTLNQDRARTSIREFWSVSDDGKTLTIETTGRTNFKNSSAVQGGTVSSKLVFTKQ